MKNSIVNNSIMKKLFLILLTGLLLWGCAGKKVVDDEANINVEELAITMWQELKDDIYKILLQAKKEGKINAQTGYETEFFNWRVVLHEAVNWRMNPTDFRVTANLRMSSRSDPLARLEYNLMVLGASLEHHKLYGEPETNYFRDVPISVSWSNISDWYHRISVDMPRHDPMLIEPENNLLFFGISFNFDVNKL